VLPVALPPWQTSVRVPKLDPLVADPGADVLAEADVDVLAEADPGVVVLLDEPARLHPPTMSVTAATAVMARREGLTGVPPR
jgi:hypothetical protein